MVTRTLEVHKKHLKEKLNQEEFEQLENILVSQKKIMQKSSNILFFSVLFVVFVLNVITSLVVLPFKELLPGVLFYGTYATCAFVLGIFVIYFIHINSEFEKHHHILLLVIFVIFSFVTVFFGHLILTFIMEGVVTGSAFSNWPIGIFSSLGILVPYLLYWVLIE